MVNFNSNNLTNIILYSTSSLKTKKIGEILGKEVLKIRGIKKAFIIGLSGELGSGKTTLLKGFAKGLGIREKIISPTFIIMRKFELGNSRSVSTGTRFKSFYHIDCYRLKSPKEILSLRLKGIISNPKNIVAIEWVDRIKKILPRNALVLKFEIIKQDTRKIEFAIIKYNAEILL